MKLNSVCDIFFLFFKCCVNGVVVYGGITVSLSDVNELQRRWVLVCGGEFNGCVIGNEVAVKIDGVAVS